ncbi:MAG: hypothetical protein KIT33_13580 [Candidatus Kapabacteria bacterium]|nr:hypothetical protein [Ignavibacteriota bacterium]MCW5885996.1 hypothetical protein [Candidatus Kapabacteria bacterium]
MISDKLSHKEAAIKLISEAPGDATIEDIMYLLYLQQKVNSGLDDFKNGKTFSQQEVEAEFE